MAQKPLKDMSYKGYDKMSEESGYVYSEWIGSVIPLYKMIEKKLRFPLLTRVVLLVMAELAEARVTIPMITLRTGSTPPECAWCS